MNKYTPEEPIVAIATALVPSAIGIVRTSGKNCIELVSKIFSRKKALLQAAGNSLVYGWIEDSRIQNGNKKIDEVMLGVYKTPKSFTGEDMVEIFCHGGVNVVTSIFSLLLENGFRKAERGEFTFRAYINGKVDLTKAEAVKEIIDSRTNASRSRAAGRLSGNLFEQISSIKKLILDTIGNIEVEIEYPEDEENISESFDTSLLKAAQKKLSDLASSWKAEKLYQDGARVVLCGKTNAGKSSLFNSLLKEERAIVSSIEGTTRDWLECWTDFAGIPVRLFDTAGLRKTSDLIEERGVELAKDLSQDADVILYLVDSSKRILKDDLDFIESQKNIPIVLVLNKCDSFDLNLGGIKKVWKDSVKISAKNNIGIEQLVLKVKDILFDGEKTEREQSGLGSARQKKSVQEALERVTHALEISQDSTYGLDAVVQDLEDSLESLGEVAGEVSPDDVLENIFSRFCVGK